MDFFESNYFDIIALPSQCIEPNTHFDDYSIRDLSDDGIYTELTTYEPFPSHSSTTSSELDQMLIFDYDESISLTPFDNLPDETFMCNDACHRFLKESSEILRMSSLKFHQQNDEKVTKSDEKVFYSCDFEDCRKTYSKPAHLKAHLRRHLGLKPYSCNFPNCSWKFSRSDELARHQRSHSGLKPYKCFYCCKQFSRSDHLKKHCKIHEKKLSDGKLKLIWDEMPKQKPGRKKKIVTASTSQAPSSQESS